MASNLVPLAFPPGIRRDGTTFDSKYCTDGNWMRFYNKRPQSIGNMQIARTPIAETAYCSNVLMTEDAYINGKYYLYFCLGTHILKASLIELNQYNQAIDPVITNIGPVTPQVASGRPNLAWQSLKLTHPGNGQRYVVFLGLNNATNIADNTAPLFYYGLDDGANTQLTPLAAPQLTKIQAMTGGMVWSAPYLFLYGRNGQVIHSKSNDPFNFDVSATDPASGGTYNNIGNGDKIVYAFPISGGRSSPSLLLWTLSSLVRMTNVGTDRVSFEVKTILRSISVLSSRCIVEKDGIFYWPGKNSFFTYNGVVTNLNNSLNKQFFFKNVKYNRQQVFSVINPEFDEIWWFFGKDGFVPPSGPFTNSTNAAIIYNCEDKTWYDTTILQRTCAFYNPSAGSMYSLGNLTSGAVNNTYVLFKHEAQGVQTISSITTPYFSFSSALPSQNSESMTDRFVELRTLFPDFNLTGVELDNGQTVPAKLRLIVNTIEYPHSKITKSAEIPISKTDTKVDLRVQGRHMSLTFKTNGVLEIGKMVLNLGVGDGQ